MKSNNIEAPIENKSQMVSCIDNLLTNGHYSTAEAELLWLVFLGDSRVRQQFYSLLRVCT